LTQGVEKNGSKLKGWSFCSVKKKLSRISNDKWNVAKCTLFQKFRTSPYKFKSSNHNFIHFIAKLKLKKPLTTITKIRTELSSNVKFKFPKSKIHNEDLFLPVKKHLLPQIFSLSVNYDFNEVDCRVIVSA
jgi:hypothetical protein